MNQKGLVPLLIVILIALAVGGYLIYQKQPKSNPVPTPLPQQAPLPQQTTTLSPTSTASPAPNSVDETTDWGIYSSRSRDFSVKYPQNWLYREVEKPAYSVEEIWFSSATAGLPPEGTDARAPIVLKVSKENPSDDWQPQYFNNYQSSIIRLPSGTEVTRVSGINKVSRLQETAAIIRADDFYILVLPNGSEESLKYFDQILSTFKFQ